MTIEAKMFLISLINNFHIHFLTIILFNLYENTTFSVICMLLIDNRTEQSHEMLRLFQYSTSKQTKNKYLKEHNKYNISLIMEKNFYDKNKLFTKKNPQNFILTFTKSFLLFFFRKPILIHCTKDTGSVEIHSIQF